MTNKNRESGAYETPAADSHINNLEWIIQKLSGFNPSNNILSRSLSAQWGLKQQTDTESNTLNGKIKTKPKHENGISSTTATKADWVYCNIKHLTSQKWGSNLGVTQKNKRAHKNPTPPRLPLQQLTKGTVLVQWIHRLHCVWIWYSASER